MLPELIATRIQAAGLPAPTSAQVALIKRFPIILDLVAPTTPPRADLFDQIFKAKSHG